MHSLKPKIIKIVPNQVQYVNLISNEGKIMKTGKEDEREYASILNEIIKELDGLKICKFDYDI